MLEASTPFEIHDILDFVIDFVNETIEIHDLLDFSIDYVNETI